MNNSFLDIQDGVQFLKELRQKNNDQPGYLINLENWYEQQIVPFQNFPSPLKAVACVFPCIQPDNYLGMLKKFCQRKKLRLPKEIDNMYVDWIDIKTKVDQFHGAKMVSSKRQWYFVSQCCGILNQEKLKQYYFQYVRKFEEYTESIGLDPLDYGNGGFLAQKQADFEFENVDAFNAANRESASGTLELYNFYLAANPALVDNLGSKLEFFWNELIGGKSQNYFNVLKLKSDDLELSLFPPIYSNIKGFNHALNFNKLRNTQDSLLRYGFWKGDDFEESSIEIGSLFSYTLWETNQQFMYSLYVVHQGEPRVWYTIASKHISKLYNLINSKYPEILQNDGIPLRIPVPLEIKELKEASIPYVSYTQLQGQVLAIFPGTYYFHVDLGINVVERLNLCIPDWLPHGMKYKKFCEAMSISPSLCIEELIFKQVMYRGGDKSHSKWIKNFWKQVANQEVQMRCQMMYYFDDLEFFPLPLKDVCARKCSLTNWPTYFTFLEDEEGKIYHPKALMELSSLLDIESLNCYVYISDLEFQTIHDQLSTVSLGDRHFWNMHVASCLNEKLKSTDIERFIEMGLSLDDNLEEVGFLNNYALYVKKIANQLPKLPIYDGQFRGRKDHKSRYTYEQIRKLDDALQSLEIDLEDLNTFHIKFSHLQQLQEKLENAILKHPSKPTIRDIKRNCERSGVLMDQHLLQVEDVEPIEKQHIDGFSFYPNTINKQELESNYQFIIPHSDIVAQIISQLKANFIFEDELDVAMHCLSRSAISNENAKFLINRSDQYFTAKQHLEALLNQLMSSEFQLFTQIVKLLEFQVLPSHSCCLRIVKVIEHFKYIYNSYRINDLSFLHAISNINSLSPAVTDLNEFSTYVKSIRQSFITAGEIVQYNINIGTKWINSFEHIVNKGYKCNDLMCYCKSNISVNEMAECYSCGIKYHRECVQIKHRSAYKCGVCKGDFSGITFLQISRDYKSDVLMEGCVKFDNNYKQIIKYSTLYEGLMNRIKNIKLDRKLVHFLLALPHLKHLNSFDGMPKNTATCPCNQSCDHQTFKWCGFCEETVHIKCLAKYGYTKVEDLGLVICSRTQCTKLGLEESLIYHEKKRVKLYSNSIQIDEKNK
eukprot:NODE_499_length_7667_cov_0.356897.p1 type:complete len:1109 gc:universal NODE_499_length_7667_cov_0.356897:3979-7305(+)